MLQSCGFGIDQSLCTRIEHPGIQSKHIGCATISTRKLGAPAPEFKVDVYRNWRTFDPTRDESFEQPIPTRFELLRAQRFGR
jgi:hypothetical protein